MQGTSLSPPREELNSADSVISEPPHGTDSLGMMDLLDKGFMSGTYAGGLSFQSMPRSFCAVYLGPFETKRLCWLAKQACNVPLCLGLFIEYAIYCTWWVLGGLSF